MEEGIATGGYSAACLFQFRQRDEPRQSLTVPTIQQMIPLLLLKEKVGSECLNNNARIVSRFVLEALTNVFQCAIFVYEYRPNRCSPEMRTRLLQEQDGSGC